MDLSVVASIGKVGGAIIKSIAPALVKKYSAHRATSRMKASALTRLGYDDSDSFDYRLPSSHPRMEAGFHPDDLAALTAVAGPIFAWHRSRGLLEVQATLSRSLDAGLIIFGSPEVEPLLRLMLGYRPLSRGAGFEYVGSSVELPFRWCEDPSEVAAESRRYVKGEHGDAVLSVRPNWPIAESGALGERRIYPQLDRKGFLRTDLLVVTSIPNFLTLQGLHGGHNVISFAGAHGIATRATELLMKDRRVLREISSRVADRDTPFQALLEVPDITHDSRRGSRAEAVKVRHVEMIRRPSRYWEAAHRDVVERFTDWQAEGEMR